MPEVDFREVQRRFAAHLRDPERHAAPEGIEERRMAIYSMRGRTKAIC